MSGSKQASVVVQLRDVGVSVTRSKYDFPRSLFDTETTQLNLVEGVNQTFQSGTLSAILGSSGSGKSTLLNLVAGRLHSSGTWRVTGTVSINNSSFEDFPSDMIAYVKQDDELNACKYLTVEETLRFAAAMRLGSRYSAQEREQLIDSVILELGLKIARHTLVGSADGLPRGCSGGERRRVSIGVQLLTNPSLLLLDEPTTGLDAFTSVNLVQTLHDLARRGRTVVMSIHQPRSAIAKLIDNITLLTRGRVAYAGPQAQMASYFNKIGHALPPFINPTDFFIDITTVDSRTSQLENVTSTRVKAIVDAWAKQDQKNQLGLEYTPPPPPPITPRVKPQYTVPQPVGYLEMDSVSTSSLAPLVPPRNGLQKQNMMGPPVPQRNRGTDAEKPQKRKSVFSQIFNLKKQPSLQNMTAPQWNKKGTGAEGRANFLSQIWTLTRRKYLSNWRDWRGLMGDFLSNVCLGGAVGLINYQLDNSLGGIRGREVVLFFSVNIKIYITLLSYMSRFASEEIIAFDREQEDRMYYPAAWVIAQVLSAIPFTVHSLAFALFAYFLPGLRLNFGIFWIVLVFCNYAGWALALVAVGLHRTYSRAALIANIVFTFLSMVTGYIIPIQEVPPWTQWFRWISFFNYAFRAVMSSEFTGYYDCPYNASTGLCGSYNGTIILQQFAMVENDAEVPFIGMCAWLLIAFLFAALALTYIKTSVSAAHSGSQSSKSTDNKDVGVLLSSRYNNLTDEELKDIRSAPVVKVVNVKLRTAPVPILSGTLRPREILKGVSATFQPGKLSVILGGSGSGKSSLLNAIAQRVQRGLFVPVVQEGKILFNGKPRSVNEIRKLTAYVTQDDTALLSSLTVMETFRFMAQLRLPNLTNYQMEEEITTLLNNLGLRECSNVLVGSDLVKGISGGQKRRVSIGVQLLTRPGVLLLDEPTSGLDAFNSRSIMMLLRALGRDRQRPMTVICSIHQPRSDIWNLIDNICVLSIGEVFYSGPAAESLAYMQSQGLPCAENTNPADHILDMASVDVRTPEAEEQTRARVQRLIKAFQATQADTNVLTSVTVVAPDEKEIDHVTDMELRMSAKPGFLRALWVLSARSTLNFTRQPEKLILRVNSGMFMAFAFAIFFARLGFDFNSIQTRLGIIYQFCALQPVGLLNAVALYPELRSALYREHKDGLYGPLPFILSWLVTEIPLQFIGAILYAIIVLFVIGLEYDGNHFWITLYAAWTLYNVGESQGLLVCSLVDDAGLTVVLTYSFQAIQGLLCGNLAVQVPTWIEDINYISAVRYGVHMMTIDQFNNNITFSCTPDQQNSVTGQCFIPDGPSVLSNVVDLDPHDFNNLLAGAICCVVMYRIAYYVVLRMRLAYF